MATAKSALGKPTRKANTEVEAQADAERFVVLLRHGVAEDASPQVPDEERSLTADGHARMKQNAIGLERTLPRVQAIYSSPLRRAMQTALWVSKAYRSRVEVRTTEALSPGATAQQFLDLLASIDVRRAVIVGHEPNLTDNLRTLLRLPEAHSIELKKGGCYGVRLDPGGRATLEWLLPPRILRELAGA